MNTAPVLLNIALSSLRPSATNPRKSFDGAALQELAESIRVAGVSVPLLVRPMFDPETGDPDVYEIVCGARRFRAARVAGLDQVPCLVREMLDTEVLDAQITENLQRADVHPMEEAAAYQQLIEAAAYPTDPDAIATALSVEDVARKVGKRVDYVAKRMKLLALHELAARLFAEGHITLDHALRLAVLTAKNQVDAMCFLLGIAAWEIKRDTPAETLIARRMDNWAAQQVAEDRQRWAGRRLVSPTDVELKRWIADHVLMQLGGVPWRLDDASLVPVAGSCIACAKRSGSSAALFSDLTAEEDVCLDTECFAAKRKAHMKYLVDEAKVSGGILLKLSAKLGNEPLPDDGVTEKMLLKRGQWLPAEKGSCAAAVPGLLRDGDEAGAVIYVCANKNCKVHRHTVAGGEKQATAKQDAAQLARREKEKAELDAKVLAERTVRLAVRDAMRAKVSDAGMGEMVIRRLLMASVDSGEAWPIAAALGVVEGERVDDDLYAERRKQDESAALKLCDFIMAADAKTLQLVALERLIVEHIAVLSWQVGDARNLDLYREHLWREAKALGVDANRIAAKRADAVLPAGTSKASTASKPAAVRKKANPPKPKVVPRKVLSDASRKRMVNAMEMRRKAAAKAVVQPAAKPLPKTMPKASVKAVTKPAAKKGAR